MCMLGKHSTAECAPISETHFESKDRYVDSKTLEGDTHADSNEEAERPMRSARVN